MKWRWTCLWVLLWPFSAQAQTETEAAPAVPSEVESVEIRAEAPVAAEGIISRVEIEGLARVEDAAILAAIDLGSGDSLSADAIRDDIEAIWATGFVDDILVHIVPDEENTERVVLRYEVVEKPAIREVRIEGNSRLDDDSINEVIDIVPFTVLNDADVHDNVERIREKYIEKGFYLAEIEVEIREYGDQLVELIFHITEHRKVLVQSIDITGNENLTDRQIRRYMQTKQAGIVPWLTSSGTFNELILEADVQVVRSVYLEEGYVDVQVDPPQIYLSPDKRFIYITINVVEGSRYELGEITVDGDLDASQGLTATALQEIIAGRTARTMTERWDDAQRRAEDAEDGEVAEGWEQRRRRFRFEQDHPPLVTGEWFQLTHLQFTMQEITDFYGDQGYAFVNVIPNMDTDPETGVVNVAFDIQRGRQVSIGRIDITGNDPTHDKVIRREITINEGDVYSGTDVNESRSRIERLGYFEEVRISTPRGAQADTLDMKVDVIEQPTGSFSVGAGFSSIENFMLTANISKNNFLGQGYTMSAAANISQLRQQGNLQIFDPYFLDSRWTLRVDGYSIARQYIENEYQRGGSLAVGRYLDQRDDIRLVFDYTFEDTGLESLDSYKENLLGGQLFRNGLTSTGGLSIIADKRNNRIQATRGIYATASVNLSGGFRQGDSADLVSVFGGEFNFL